MFSLKPKDGGGSTAPLPSPQNTNLLKGGIALSLVLILGLGYNAYSTRTSLEDRIGGLEKQLTDQADQMKTVQKHANDMDSDIAVVTKKVGVTASDLDVSRKFAEKLRSEQEKAQQQIASELATKASTNDVAAAREEANTKVAQVQQVAETKIGNVDGEVKKVDAKADGISKDLADSRRDLSDVKTTLSAQIARNASELGDLRKKGERDYFEFTLMRPKKNEMTRVADIQLQLHRTDPKRAKYDVLIQVDDSKLEKKDRTANEPVQFLVGRDKLRYEIVINFVDKDKISGYLSTPKDKVLSAERPNFRPQ
jgi:septal ring factor EnvC (AmiA/AmiB activator)